MHISCRIFPQPNFEHIITASAQGLYAMAECSYRPILTFSKLAVSPLCSTETTKSMDLVRKKTRLRETRPQYLPLVCQAGGAQPHRGKFT
jgi:hypothetical protein